MELDMDLVREILLELEQLPWTDSLHELELEGRSSKEVMYHVKMMGQANLLDIFQLNTHDGPGYYPIDITWEGQQFLAKIKSVEVYEQAKTTLLQKTGALAFDLLASVASRLAERAVFGS